MSRSFAPGVRFRAAWLSLALLVGLADCERGATEVRTRKLPSRASFTIVGSDSASPGGAYTGVEGSSVSFNGSGSSTQNGDTLAYDWDYGDGSPHDTGATPTHTYVDNGTYTVTLVVSDTAGSSAPAQTTATIANAAPVVTSLTGPGGTPRAGAALTVTGSFTDAGILDTHTASIAWGDSTSAPGTVTEKNGSGTASGSHTYAAAGTYAVILTITDKDGGTGADTLSLVVARADRAPIANAGGPYSGKEGTAVTFTGNGSWDPDNDPITYDWDWGDGTPHGTGNKPKHTYADDGTYTVTLVVTDSCGVSSAPAHASAMIANVAPAITALGAPTASFPVDYPLSVSASFKDPGVLDTHTASIDWGDGFVSTPARLYDSSGTGTTGGVHTFAAPGAYTVTITVTDNGGASTSRSVSLQATTVATAKVLVGVGDIALCTANGDEQTAGLVDQVPGAVQIFGDDAYPNGSTSDFSNCYDPASSWGRHKDRTHPAIGNHEYYTAGALPYFTYFGAAAGPAGLGYYSYDLGSWHIVVVNPELDVSLGSDENTWLRNDLAGNTRQCTAIVMHEPLFSSGPTGGLPRVKAVWDAAYQYHVTLMLDGHEHDYERFAPQDPSGNADPVNGIREFVVGTGGDGNVSRWGKILPNSEVRYMTTFGVIKLTLDAGSYSWQFIPTKGAFNDSGSANCHG